VRDLSIPPEISVCPIVREADGLAMSSRNVYLSPTERIAATVLYRALDRVRTQVEAGERSAAGLIATAHGVLAAEPLAATDYVEVVDADSFEPATILRRTCFVVMAMRIGATRLIDNLMIDVLEADIGSGTGTSVSCCL
jgi:pantoate--beta-alanine ligase